MLLLFQQQSKRGKLTWFMDNGALNLKCSIVLYHLTLYNRMPRDIHINVWV